MRYLMMAVCALLLIVSCKKVETPTSREEELRDGKWRLNVSTLKVSPYMGPVTTINLLSLMSDCLKDDYIVFKENYQATQNSNGNKCSNADPDEIMFRWELYNNGTSIQIWNATQTFLGFTTYSGDLINYSTSRFTIRRTEYSISSIDPTKFDTSAYTQTFVKN